MKRTLAPTLVAASMLLVACTGSDGGSEPAGEDDPAEEPGEDPTDDPGGDPGDPNAGPIGFAPASLRQFDECDAFLDYVRTEGAERVGPYGFESNGWIPGPMPMIDMALGDVGMEESADMAMDDSADLAAAPAPSDPGAPSEGTGGGDFSTTNVQVQGVDEPDIVKTDGDRILAIAGERLHLASVSADGSDATLTSSVQLSDPNGELWMWGSEILFDGDRAFVIGQSEWWGPFDDFAVAEPALAEPTLPAEEVDDPELVDPDPAAAEEGAPLRIDQPAEVVLDDESSVSVAAPGDDEVVDEAISEPAPEPEPEPEPLPVEPDAPIGGPWPPSGYQGPTTIVHEVDLSNPQAIAIVNTLEVRGRYVSARQIGSTARLVVTSAPADLGFVFPSDGSDRAIAAATETNQRLVAESDLEHWLPGYTLRTQQGVSEGELVDCAAIHAPSEFAGFDMLSILTFDTDEALGAPTDTTSVMASGDTVYASQDRLYVSTNVWLPPTIEEQELGLWEDEYETQIHRFTIAGDGPADYEASGTVDGHLLNQFSMNDRDGTFFVATTSGTPWGAQPDTDNQIIAMEQQGEELVEIGRVDDLGLEGERIFSVRYVDDVAYLVTFRQTDPFYVLDLSDPTNMRVLGELKIPGFSSYLHPITDTLVLGVGQDADEDGRTTGTKVSLFDVSDRSNPTELDVWTLPGGGSGAEFDHRAFLYWPDTLTAFLPVTVWDQDFSGAVALRIDGDGITELGRITQQDPPETEPGQTDCRVLDPSSFSEEDGELFWIAEEGLLLACDDQDQGGATGYVCDPIFTDDIQFWTRDGEVPEVLADVDRIEICWTEGFDWERQITRTLVIGDALWSLSASRLQANDLITLEAGDIVELPG